MTEIVDVYRERKAIQVMNGTWGHLKPNPGRTYTGTLVYANGDYGDSIPVTSEFDGLPDSPWYFEAMLDFIEKQDPATGVYRFTGTYTADRGHVFDGTIERIDQ